MLNIDGVAEACIIALITFCAGCIGLGVLIGWIIWG